MSETNEWATAPKDGTEITVKFPDGTGARARWNADANGRWEVLRGDRWLSMHYEHGSRDPEVWCASRVGSS